VNVISTPSEAESGVIVQESPGKVVHELAVMETSVEVVDTTVWAPGTTMAANCRIWLLSPITDTEGVAAFVPLVNPIL
jgi:hypothetical protein